MERIIDLQPINRRVKMGCGATLNVTIWSSNSDLIEKPNCVLLHGLDNNSRIWDALAKKIALDMNVYAIDFRGHGDSDKSHIFFYNRPRFVEDIEEVRKYFGLGKVYIVGHSLGASVACSYAAQYRDLVSGLALCDMGLETNNALLDSMRTEFASRKRDYSSVAKYLKYLETVYVIANSKNLHAFAQHSIRMTDKSYQIKTDPKCLNPLISELIDINKPIATGAPTHIWTTISKLRCPLLILKAEYSSALSIHTANKLIASTTQSKLHVIKRSGHALMLDKPEETSSAIHDFFYELEKENDFAA